MAPIDEYRTVKPLGRGAFGETFLAKHSPTRELFVIKKLPYTDVKSEEEKAEREAAQREVAVLCLLHHPNITAYRESFIDTTSKTLNIVLEFCEGGDLGSVIHRQKAKQGKQHLSEDKLWSWITQLLFAVDHCHQQGILHRDIKPGNVFLTKKEQIKLGDFGISKVVSGNTSYHSNSKFALAGTAFYLAPEICESKGYFDKSDVWALGVTLYELCAFRTPFAGSNVLAVVNAIVTAQPDPLPPQYSPKLNQLIMAMLTKDYTIRPTINRLIHDFIKEEMTQRMVRQVQQFASLNPPGIPLRLPPSQRAKTKYRPLTNHTNVSTTSSGSKSDSEVDSTKRARTRRQANARSSSSNPPTTRQLQQQQQPDKPTVNSSAAAVAIYNAVPPYQGGGGNNNNGNNGRVRASLAGGHIDPTTCQPVTQQQAQPSIQNQATISDSYAIPPLKHHTTVNNRDLTDEVTGNVYPPPSGYDIVSPTINSNTRIAPSQLSTSNQGPLLAHVATSDPIVNHPQRASEGKSNVRSASVNQSQQNVSWQPGHEIYVPRSMRSDGKPVIRESPTYVTKSGQFTTSASNASMAATRASFPNTSSTSSTNTSLENLGKNMGGQKTPPPRHPVVNAEPYDVVASNGQTFGIQQQRRASGGSDGQQTIVGANSGLLRSSAGSLIIGGTGNYTPPSPCSTKAPENVEFTLDDQDTTGNSSVPLILESFHENFPNRNVPVVTADGGRGEVGVVGGGGIVGGVPLGQSNIAHNTSNLSALSTIEESSLNELSLQSISSVAPPAPHDPSSQNNPQNPKRTPPPNKCRTPPLRLMSNNKGRDLSPTPLTVLNHASASPSLPNTLNHTPQSRSSNVKLPSYPNPAVSGSPSFPGKESFTCNTNRESVYSQEGEDRITVMNAWGNGSEVGQETPPAPLPKSPIGPILSNGREDSDGEDDTQDTTNSFGLSWSAFMKEKMDLRKHLNTTNGKTKRRTKKKPPRKNTCCAIM